MVIRGLYRKIKKDIRSIPKIFSPDNTGHLYLFKTNGNMKVGKSKSIAKRIDDHNRTSRLYSGRNLFKVAVFGPHSDIDSMEIAILHEFRKKYTILNDEWFKGDFEEAADFV